MKSAMAKFMPMKTMAVLVAMRAIMTTTVVMTMPVVMVLNMKDNGNSNTHG